MPQLRILAALLVAVLALFAGACGGDDEESGSDSSSSSGGETAKAKPVSYTHLTLPTIYSV